MRRQLLCELCGRAEATLAATYVDPAERIDALPIVVCRSCERSHEGRLVELEVLTLPEGLGPRDFAST